MFRFILIFVLGIFTIFSSNLYAQNRCIPDRLHRVDSITAKILSGSKKKEKEPSTPPQKQLSYSDKAKEIYELYRKEKNPTRRKKLYELYKRLKSRAEKQGKTITKKEKKKKTKKKIKRKIITGFGKPIPTSGYLIDLPPTPPKQVKRKKKKGLKKFFCKLERSSEKAIGRTVVMSMEATYGLNKDPELNRRLNRVGNYLKRVYDRDISIRFKIINMGIVNAFAVPGGTIYVTPEILRFVNSDSELAFVLGHEIGHIVHYDMIFMTLVATLVGIVSMISDIIIHRFYFEDEDSLTVDLISVLIAITTPIVANIIQLAISREREYLQDVFSAKLNGSPWGLISAFEKIGKELKVI